MYICLEAGVFGDTNEPEYAYERNEMNYAMDRRLVHCLQRGLPLDIDVYDAAEWSCLAELTRESAMAHGKQVKIPDFTNFG